MGTLCALLPFTTVGGGSGARQAGSARANDHLPGEAAVLHLAAQTSTAPEPPARDTPGLGPGVGIDRVLLRFEGPISASLTALAESDLRTAFGRRGVEIDRPDVGSSATSTPASGVVLTIVITNERLEQVALKLEEKSPVVRVPAGGPAGGAVPAAAARPSSAVAPGDDAAAVAFTLGRRLDLNAFPPDGRMLALVVAADEMLVAAGTEHWRHVRAASRGDVESPRPGAVEAEAAPSPPPPTSAAATAPRREAVQEPPATAMGPEGVQPAVRRGALGQERNAPVPWPRDGLATTFAFDRFGGGQTHLGFDLAWRRRLGGRWHASVAAQGRQGRTVTTAAGTIDAGLLGGRLALGLTLVDDGGRLWLTLDAGARAGGLRFEGRGTAPDGRSTGHQVDTFVAYADATLALDVRLGRSPLALRLAVGAGLPLLAQDAAASDGSVVTGASGAAFESQAGLALSF